MKTISKDSFVAGVTFTDKPINMNERIYMKIVDIDESGQWLGSLAIGNEKLTDCQKVYIPHI